MRTLVMEGYAVIYCQLRERAKLAMGDTLRLSDVADATAPPEAMSAVLDCPDQEGVWKVDALQCARALQRACGGEDVSMLGPDVCYVHRIRVQARDWTKWLRTAAAFLILLLGSALGLCWFHSDVDMPAAQTAVFQLLTGREISDPRLITVPYVIGVALGVAVFYALPSRRATTPLEVKLTEYQEDMEKTEGKDAYGRK